MISRKSFLRLVRNRVAAGVLCSGMLTDALEGFELAEVFPSMVPRVHIVDYMLYLFISAISELG